MLWFYNIFFLKLNLSHNDVHMNLIVSSIATHCIIIQSEIALIFIAVMKSQGTKGTNRILVLPMRLLSPHALNCCSLIFWNPTAQLTTRDLARELKIRARMTHHERDTNSCIEKSWLSGHCSFRPYRMNKSLLLGKNNSQTEAMRSVRRKFA